jgi:hypothetical protein
MGDSSAGAVLGGTAVFVDEGRDVGCVAGEAGCAGAAQPANAIAPASISRMTFALMGE